MIYLHIKIWIFKFYCLILQPTKLLKVNTMDIVNRLKSFMEIHHIGSTQFADTCGIPRPTLSQILSGRNKKISDEVIAKIHNAYPQLSVLWLLFGEGQMETTANIQFSEPLNGGQTPLQGASINALSASNNVLKKNANEEDAGLFGLDNSEEPLLFDVEETPTEVQSESSLPHEDPQPGVIIPADGSKSIVNIMVFYSDNSYQSFIPR